MSPLVTIALPALLVVVAGVLARRELRLWRRRGPDDAGFAYTTARLVRRLVGVAVLLALAGTFVALGVAPPREPGAAAFYLASMVGEVLVLLLLAGVDLFASSRRATRGDGRR